MLEIGNIAESMVSALVSECGTFFGKEKKGQVTLWSSSAMHICVDLTRHLFSLQT